ncbi:MULTISPECIES: hypothetical protein [Rhodobacterales]|uniref:hypothetical protein n=1 Tax=Roseobacter sp. N2S TaxID=2663844 RepID=UPI00285E03EB|nr:MULTISPECIES: hypothetical protein [Rhodobacterales]MDR6263452.1 hypothetical protein [Roseobacter sp. N2S]
MKHRFKIRIAALLLAFVASANIAVAQDSCYADYKAKRSASGSLQLHYGVIQLNGGACRNPQRAAQAVSRRIASDGWTLLRVVSTFDQRGLQQRRGNAGQFFLRY